MLSREAGKCVERFSSAACGLRSERLCFCPRLATGALTLTPRSAPGYAAMKLGACSQEVSLRPPLFESAALRV